MSTPSADISLRMVGYVARAHGILGAVKVRPETDDPYRFNDLERVFIGPDDAHVRRYAVEEVSHQPSNKRHMVLLQLEGVSGRPEAESLVGQVVCAAEEDLPPLEEGEVFLADLVGLKLLGEEGESFGVVRDVLDLPAQPVLVVESPGGSEAMVPYVSEFIVSVDMDGGTMVVRPIEGLLDGEPESERAE